MSDTPCPACQSHRTVPIYSLDAIPVQSCILLDTEEEARSFPRRPLHLELCKSCGFVFNALFELEMVDYASTTEESQHFSGTFNRFAQTLVQDIAARERLDGRLVLEIGCGKGDFLKELVATTGSRGLGVDPGFIPDRLPGTDDREIRFQREYFDPANIAERPDYVVCRHTLEHIPEVGPFMSDVSAVLDGRRDVGIFFETPDVARVLDEGAFWDIYYEHCSYFTLGSHARLFRQAGLGVQKTDLAYEGQYIIQYAQPGDTPALAQEDDLEELHALAETFPEKVAQVRRHWHDFVADRHRDGRRVAIWGGGSKGVSFLTTDGLGDMVANVVDVNPHKQGKYLPGAGLRVSAPDELREAPPDTVIVMNPVYVEEIRADLAAMDLHPELVAV
ncbi:C-methyltransferase [Roseivivax marinus]|uniref:C-methyltransferase n=1 Tax=Roseivivax marinus TaxID=1379903 RepID=W4HMI3_9RHOB|nr:class I SAM-dependent methyltransferase [Roseivivax marinus]ETW13205.1 C-methyltransferase [Roseivivax marinus]UMA63293.1 class I SAM-dependent methyltransferase [Roseivivax marinus]